MIIDKFVRTPGVWLSTGDDAGIVISSRVRLARNVRDFAFPGWAGEEECRRLCRHLCESLRSVAEIVNPVFFDMGLLNGIDKEVLMERHLISKELAQKGAGSGLMVSRDEGIAVMVNEEDHLRLQAISPGMSLKQIWHRIDEVDSRLEELLDYAFSEELGYATACPSNVGTGLRASVMMHLAGLKLMNEIEPALHGLDRLGFAVRGLFGEGTDAHGNMFQISNQVTLGGSEGDMVDGLVDIAGEIARHEKNARLRVLGEKRARVDDTIGRALGILTHARVLSSSEAVELLSNLRLGVTFGLLQGLTVADINGIMLLTQPGHLQRILGRELDQDERDEERARMVRERIRGVRFA